MMNETEAEDLKKDLRKAFKKAIEKIGIENFKKCSWFLSNDRVTK